MPGATRPVRPWGHDERETMNQLGSATEWRCGLPASPRDAAKMLAAHSLPGRWRRWRQATGNDEEARLQELSGRRERREQSGTRRGLGEHLPWMRRSDGMLISGKKISAHPFLARQMFDIGFRQNP